MTFFFFLDHRIRVSPFSFISSFSVLKCHEKFGRGVEWTFSFSEVWEVVLSRTVRTSFDVGTLPGQESQKYQWTTVLEFFSSPPAPFNFLLSCPPLFFTCLSLGPITCSGNCSKFTHSVTSIPWASSGVVKVLITYSGRPRSLKVGYRLGRSIRKDYRGRFGRDRVRRWYGTPTNPVSDLLFLNTSSCSLRPLQTLFPTPLCPTSLDGRWRA